MLIALDRIVFHMYIFNCVLILGGKFVKIGITKIFF